MLTLRALVHSLLWNRVGTGLVGTLVAAHSLWETLEWRLVVAVRAYQVGLCVCVCMCVCKGVVRVGVCVCVCVCVMKRVSNNTNIWENDHINTQVYGTMNVSLYECMGTWMYMYQCISE